MNLEELPQNDISVEESEHSTGELTKKETHVAGNSKAGQKKSEEHVALKREIGFFSAVGLIVSVMIGSGIFVSPKSVLENSGSVYVCLIIWGSCGFISYLGALSFAELGTVVSDSGAEYAYFQAAFTHHPRIPRFFSALPSFLFVWVIVLVVRPAEVAILVLTFAEYLYSPFMDLHSLELGFWHELILKKMIACLAIGLITYVNFTSVKLYVKIQNLFSSLKLIACLLVIGGGLYSFFKDGPQHIENGFEGTKSNVKDWVLAFYGGLWAYDGWSSVAVVTEEIKNPNKNIPASISFAVPLITVLYVMMNFAYMTVLSKDELLKAPAVATMFAEKIFGHFSFVIPIGVALSTFGCGMSVQFGVSRLCYASGRAGHMFESLSYIHVRKFTPAPAVVLQGMLSFIFILFGSITELIEFVSFLIWIFYGLAMVALIVLRKTRPHVKRPYKVPIIIPIIIMTISVGLASIPVALSPAPQFLGALAFVILGVVVYTIFIFMQWHPKWLERVTFYVQVLFEVVPPEEAPESKGTNKKSLP